MPNIRIYNDKYRLRNNSIINYKAKLEKILLLNIIWTLFGKEKSSAKKQFSNYSLGIIIGLFLIVWLKPERLATACSPTTPPSSPTPPVCCHPLTHTLSSTEFSDGIMTFNYNNNICRRTVVASCSVSNPKVHLYAGIVANNKHFLDFHFQNVTSSGTCVNMGQWSFGNPPLIIDTLECIITNEPHHYND